jgi:cell division septation protein DedD
MKNVHIFLLSTVVLIFSLSACGGESEEEKQARLQAYQDSLRAVEQAKIEAMMIEMEDSITTSESNTIDEEMDETTNSEYDFSEEGQFLVQVGAWRSEEKAQSYVDSWSDRDYPNAYVIKTGNELTGDIWFRVRIGYFSTPISAENFGSELSTEINSGYWVVNKN